MTTIEGQEKKVSWLDGLNLLVPIPEPVLGAANFVLIILAIWMNTPTSYCLLYLSKTLLFTGFVRTKQPLLCSFLGFGATIYTVWSLSFFAKLLLDIGPIIGLESRSIGIAWALSDVPLALFLICNRKVWPALLVLLIDYAIGALSGYKYG